jgi:hypothetical protein
MDLLTINCIWNSKNALRNEVDANSIVLARVEVLSKLESAVWEESAALELKLFSEINFDPSHCSSVQVGAVSEIYRIANEKKCKHSQYIINTGLL